MNLGRVPAILAGLLIFLTSVQSASFLSTPSTPSSLGEEVPASDIRLTEIRHLDLRYTFSPYKTRDEWLQRAQSLRRQILVSAGIWPLGARPPVRAEVFGKTDRRRHD